VRARNPAVLALGLSSLFFLAAPSSSCPAAASPEAMLAPRFACRAMEAIRNARIKASPRPGHGHQRTGSLLETSASPPRGNLEAKRTTPIRILRPSSPASPRGGRPQGGVVAIALELFSGLDHRSLCAVEALEPGAPDLVAGPLSGEPTGRISLAGYLGCLNKEELLSTRPSLSPWRGSGYGQDMSPEGRTCSSPGHRNGLPFIANRPRKKRRRTAASVRDGCGRTESRLSHIAEACQHGHGLGNPEGRPGVAAFPGYRAAGADDLRDAARRIPVIHLLYVKGCATGSDFLDPSPCPTRDKEDF